MWQFFQHRNFLQCLKSQRSGTVLNKEVLFGAGGGGGGEMFFFFVCFVLVWFWWGFFVCFWGLFGFLCDLQNNFVMFVSLG